MSYGADLRADRLAARSIDSLWKSGEFAVVLHDAGAAAHVLAWLAEDPRLARNARVYAEGPALRMAGAAGVKTLKSVNSALDSVNWALVGTGWQSNLEQSAMKLCSQFEIPCVAVVDHWVNYRDRFASLAAGERPECVAVTDAIAEAIAQEELPWATVVRWPNTQGRRLQRLVDALRKGQANRDRYLLWLQEPLRTEGGEVSDPLTDMRWATRIWQLLDEAMKVHRIPQLVIRIHPSQEYVAYEAADRSVEIHDAGAVPIGQDLAGASLCLGINSYALYLASLTGTRAASIANSIGVSPVIPAQLVAGYSSDL